MARIDRAEFADLRLFLAIVRRQSFKAAAIEFGLSPSAASHAIRRLESRLGVKLINRTTRAIMATELGQDLANKLAEGFDKLDEALQTLDAPGAASFGEVRINAFSDAAHLLIAPALPEFAETFPDVNLGIVVENRPIDIVAEGYDAGIRYGHLVPEDMVAVALSGPQRWVVAGAPNYLARHGKPDTPEDLGNHTCLQLLLGDNSRFPWELGTGPDQKSYRVPGHITIQDTATTISAAKAGLGLAYLLESRIAEELANGQLEIVLEDYASTDDPFHMYYSSRHNNHPGLRGLINIIRKQNGLSRI
ncbi:MULTISPECIES: LysR family transcriptional regulator [Thalassospira]|uniref:LysR family transcriptional regulator n=1 Tax=Thalassospira profundimaris TaxID=502049 RepID=A0A367VG28_9PROT|nr:MULTISPECIES: LysR family transcriptional regulator [Thalassospira]KZB71545.1 LysR family transcriptional regulator [Thalassospira sp. MCCC 1A01148]RCK24135.1 LysR family transcriptional regulator [Thalassospira profundimaris]